MSGPLARCHVCQHTVAEDQSQQKRPYYRRALKPLLSPPQVLSTALSVFFLSVPRSKQVKCLKRCIEVSLRILYDGYVIWHNASECPSQIKWQMLFFASWIFLGQADFEIFLFAVLLCLSLWLCSRTLSSAHVFFLSTMTLQKSTILFFLLNFKHNYSVIARQGANSHWCLTSLSNWHSTICFV